jgi:hypothetical protein
LIVPPNDAGVVRVVVPGTKLWYCPPLGLFSRLMEFWKLKKSEAVGS